MLGVFIYKTYHISFQPSCQNSTQSVVMFIDVFNIGARWRSVSHDLMHRKLGYTYSTF